MYGMKDDGEVESTLEDEYSDGFRLAIEEEGQGPSASQIFGSSRVHSTSFPNVKTQLDDVSIPATPLPARPPPTPRSPSPTSISLKNEIHRLAREPRFWLVVVAQTAMTAMFEWEAWISYFLLTIFSVDLDLATAAAVSFSAGCTLALILNAIATSLALTRAQSSILRMLSIVANAIVCLCLIASLFAVAVSPQIAFWSTVFLIFLFGFTLAVPVYVTMSVFALEFGGEASCSLIVGTVDAFAYIGGALFDIITGILLKNHGKGAWTFVLLLLLSFAVIAVISLSLFTFLDIKHYRRNTIENI